MPYPGLATGLGRACIIATAAVGMLASSGNASASTPAPVDSAASAAAMPSPSQTSAAGAVLAWHLDPSAHYVCTVHMTHVIANDLGGIYKKLAGSKADPVTIVEDRTVDFAAGPGGAVDASIVDVRHYGGMQSKNSSEMKRTAEYKGTIAPDGKRNPTDEPLVDPGSGALSEFPSAPVTVGQSWSLSRDILIDRDLGHGAMTYTDTLSRIETRNGHKVAVIAVKGAGKVDVASDLKGKGFQTADITLVGIAEFDTTTGIPGAEHYTAHVQWNTHVLWVHLGLIFDDTYDSVPWTMKAR